MANFNLETNFTSSANRERINLYKASAPNAIVDQLTYNPPHVGGHSWTFYNLIPSENYLYRWLEIDGNGSVIQQYGSQNFTVPAYGSTKSKATQYLIADTTPGVMSGPNTIAMNGQNGTDDWRGWGIVWEKKGFGTEFPAIEYTYDIATGTVTLTNADSTPYEIQPGERFTVHFEDQTIGAAPVVVAGSFTGIRYFTGPGTIDATDFGRNLIQVDGATAFFDINLPPINSVPENKELIIKSGRGNHTNFRINALDPNVIDWLYGSMTSFYMGRMETIRIYRQLHNGFSSYQVIDASGNFYHVGTIVEEFTPLASTFNKVAADNTIYNANVHARLYDYVLRLPPGEVVSFANWATDSRKYSLANGAGQFHVPDLRNLYSRVTDGSITPGTYQSDMVGPLTATYPIASNQSAAGNLVYGRGGSVLGTGNATIAGTGSETRPKSYVTRKYILC